MAIYKILSKLFLIWIKYVLWGKNRGMFWNYSKLFVMTLFRLKIHVPGEFIGIEVGALDATANSLRITVLLYVFVLVFLTSTR